MNSSSSAKRTISSYFSWISLRVSPRMTPLMKMFSRPEISGWKPAPSSIRAEMRPLGDDLAGGGLADAGQDLQHGALARAVLADDAQGLPGLDVERHAAQGFEALADLQVAEERLVDQGALDGQELVAVGVFLVELEDVAGPARLPCQTSSTKVSRSLSKSR